MKLFFLNLSETCSFYENVYAVSYHVVASTVLWLNLTMHDL